MEKLKKVFRYLHCENVFVKHLILMSYFLCRNKNKKPSFPEICHFDMNSYNSNNPQEEVSDSFHWLLDFNNDSTSETYDDMSLDRKQYDIIEKRRNFAITRSRSFAQPIQSGQTI